MATSPIVACLAALLLISGCGSSSGPDAPFTTTSIKLFEPFADVGSGSGPVTVVAGLHVDKTLAGSCSSGSYLDSREDAWRCNAPRTYDPCFALPVDQPPSVACTTAPWSSVVTVIRLTKRLPEHQANAPSNPKQMIPWAIVLADGTRCVQISSSRWVIAGLSEEYDCGSGTLVFGYVDMVQQPWTADVRAQGSSELHESPVKEAWD